MSRPTNASKYEQSETWMRETFGAGIQDYLAAETRDPISVCVVEIAKVINRSNADELLASWRDEDMKSGAGRQAILSPTAALCLILLQKRLRRPTLITEMSATFLQLSRTQRSILGMTHDGHDLRSYDRIWSSIQRLIALVDEFPGRRDRVLKEAEFAAVIRARDAAECLMRRERMFTLANALLEGSRQFLPKELQKRTDGNVALDATFIPLYGKSGNPKPANLNGNRHTTNPDGGWYGRGGNHGAMTDADAAAHNKANPKDKAKGTPRELRWWGVEAEIARMTSNYRAQDVEFPLLTVGLSFHIPGALTGEGLRIADSLIERGHTPNLFIVDRAYNSGRYNEYAVPLRLRGYKHVFDYKDADLGVQAFDPRGFVQISGSWYLDTLPKVLREADGVVRKARNVYEALKLKLKNDPTLNAEQRLKYRAAARKTRDFANDLHKRQSVQRAKSMLRPKGLMSADWTRRYLVPIDSPDYKTWSAVPGNHKGVTVSMKRPQGKEAENSNAGGFKHEQYFTWGTEDWQSAYGMRNGVESVNRNLKRSQYEDVANAEHRAVRGNTFTYLVIAVATVIENLRKVMSFYKEALKIKTLTPKNNRLPSAYWQSTPRSEFEAARPD